MKRKSYVYKHTRLDKDEVFYIGIGCTKDYQRAYSHYARNTYWKNIVNKTEYKVDIIEEKISWDEACELETKLIKKYGRRDLNEGTLVNLTDGGDGAIGLIQTEEHKRKISKAKSGKNCYLYGVTGKDHPRYGKISTEETKKKLSEVHRGENSYLFGLTGKDHPRYGTKHSEETKKKISEANIGKDSYLLGLTGKDHPKSKAVVQYDRDGIMIREWKSLSVASRKLKINKGNISSCCSGRLKTAGGYIWKYK